MKICAMSCFPFLSSDVKFSKKVTRTRIHLFALPHPVSFLCLFDRTSRISSPFLPGGIVEGQMAGALKNRSSPLSSFACSSQVNPTEPEHTSHHCTRCLSSGKHERH